jgi:isopenicillin N synthase-like dioxygenase
MSALAIFDVAELDAGRGIADLCAACEGLGFFYIRNHGIDPAIIGNAEAQMHALFALPLEARMKIALAHSTCHHGYEPMQAQTLEAGTPPDLKEGFYIGNELGPDHAYVQAGYFNQGPNQWPAELPEFRPAMTAYFAALERLACRLMRAMALSLDLPADHFAPFCAEPMSVLRLLHYPPQPANPQPGEKGCGAHTDWGCLTLLWQDGNGGLQVQSRGEWIAAPPIDGSYVVNIGDMFARWTNNRYRSTLHRVINASGRERYSMPFFFEGSPGHPVAALPGCVKAGESPLFAPTTVSAHLAEMYRLTFA